jgi:putative zinc finger/helix-turn-helix YgiT family protein
MKCVNCGHAMTATRGTHRYTESGLSNVTLANIEIRTCPQCGERRVVIPKMDLLHRMIAKALIRANRPFAPDEIRFLRKWLGLSSLDFALVMGVRPETVSRWENGKYPFPPTADRLLRLLVSNQEPMERYPIDLFKLKHHARPTPIRLKAPDWKEAAS